MSQTVSPLALAHLSHLQAGVGMGSGVGRPVSGIDRVGSPLEVLRKSCKRRCPPVALPSAYQTRANLEPSSGGQGSCLLFPFDLHLVLFSQSQKHTSNLEVQLVPSCSPEPMPTVQDIALFINTFLALMQ